MGVDATSHHRHSTAYCRLRNFFLSLEMSKAYSYEEIYSFNQHGTHQKQNLSKTENRQDTIEINNFCSRHIVAACSGIETRRRVRMNVFRDSLVGNRENRQSDFSGDSVNASACPALRHIFPSNSRNSHPVGALPLLSSLVEDSATASEPDCRTRDVDPGLSHAQSSR